MVPIRQATNGFDPRVQKRRYGLILALGLAGGIAVWKLAAVLLTPDAPVLDAKTRNAWQHAAFISAEMQAGYGRPRTMEIEVRSGETLETAVTRSGISGNEARQAVRALGAAMDTVNIKAGLVLDAAVAAPQAHQGPARLIGLSMRTNPTTVVTLSRTFDGALRLRELEEQVRAEQSVAQGEIHGSLYESVAKLGADAAISAQLVKLFSHKIDFDRDLKPGDPFQLVFDRDVTENGRTVQTGDLEFAQIKGNKFYRFERASGVEYFDETGKNIKGFLLRTPVDGANMTSGFGMRHHPILGFNRMHQGIDFGAGIGTPVLAAGDGVVVEAKRWAGYGNWLRISHGNGWETGYAHLSRYAKGLKPGQRVRQGQLVAYVGSTGMSTGAHLHYEIWQKGLRIDPTSARVPQGTVLAGAELADFRVQRARLDRLVSGGGSGGTGVGALARLDPTAHPPALRR